MSRTVSLTPLPSLARTTTQTTSDLRANGARGIQIVLDVTALTATGTLTVSLKGKDPASGKYFKLVVDFTTITATGTYVYEVWPGAPAAAADVTARVNGCLPETFQIVVTAGNGVSITYSLGVNLLASEQH